MDPGSDTLGWGMPWWMWLLLVWLAASLLLAWGASRWFRWLRGDFD